MKPHWCAPRGGGAVRVLHSSPQGDCFFCSISLLLTGHEGYKHTLRLHALIELILHPAEYLPAGRTVMVNLVGEQAQQATLGSSYIQAYIDTVEQTAKPGSYVPAGLAAPLSEGLGTFKHGVQRQ